MTTGLPSAGLRLAVVLVSLAVVAFAIGVAGHDPAAAGVAALDGAFGSSYAVLSVTLKRATPLLLLGVAVAIAFRAGMLNIGGEGQFLAGASASAAIGLSIVSLPSTVGVPLGLIAGALGGAAWAGIAAWMRFRFRVNEVVSTLLLNFVALHLVGFLVRGPLQEASGAYPQTEPVAAAVRLPLVIPGQRLHAGFVVAVVVTLAAWFVFRHTRAGFRLRIVGANPHVADVAGRVSVDRVQARALLASGACAGLAGASELLGVTYALYEGLSPGYGYTAIGVALLGNLNPPAIAAAALFFGALGTGADAMQRNAGIPAEFATLVASLCILGVLAAAALRSRARAVVPEPAA